MNAYANLALLFEQMRIRASRKARGETNNHPAIKPPAPGTPDGPPRVLILGAESSGRTTACKILINYAVRTPAAWSPMLVNLDTSDGAYTVPGTISACPVDSPIVTSSPANPLGFTATSAPTSLSSSSLLPIAFWFGHAELRQKIMLMERLIRNLGESVAVRTRSDPKSHSSGLFVDTPVGFAAASAGDKYKLLRACVEAFAINVILVIGHEKLMVEMQKLYGSEGSRMAVIKIPKSGGVVEVDQIYRDRVLHLQMRNYMYGSKLSLPPGLSASDLGGEGLIDMSLAPHSSHISFDDLTIYRIGEELMAPSSALPIGAQRTVSETQPVLLDPAQPGSGLLNAVLALLSPPNADENERYDEEILDLDVVAFLVVTAIDIPNRKMTILSPGPGSISGRTALIGSFEWQEL